MIASLSPRTLRGMREIHAPARLIGEMMDVDLVALAESYVGAPFRAHVELIRGRFEIERAWSGEIDGR